MRRSDKAKGSEKEHVLELLMKDAMKYILPTKVGVLKLAVLSGAVTLASISHGLNEAWAWKIAELLITIDGLVLGFAILGMTILSTREFTQGVHESMIHESVNDLKKLAKANSMNKSSPDRKPELLALVIRPNARLKVLGISFMSSAECLLVSIGLALCLFGVNDSTMGSPFGSVAFLGLYGASVGVFGMAVYILMKALSFLMENPPISLDGTLDSMIKMLEQEKMPRKEEKKDDK